MKLLKLISIGLFLCFVLSFIAIGRQDNTSEELGATIIDNGVTKGVYFHVYSEHATKIQVLIFSNAKGQIEPDKVYDLERIVDEGIKGPSCKDTNEGKEGTPTNYWGKFVPGIGAGTYYGFRAWGPNWEYSDKWVCGNTEGFLCDVDKYGNRYNPNKLLIDPYAKAISHDQEKGPDFASGPQYRSKCNYDVAPKSIVVDDTFSWGTDKPLNIPFEKSIIYEVHLRGFTKNKNSGVSHPGTYLGFAEKVSYLKELGITAVELLPIGEFIDEQNGKDSNYVDDNYWGYNTMTFVSNNRRYSSDQLLQGPVDELKSLVKTLHENGIEVILDVVYSHTAEGGLWYGEPQIASLYNFRALDNIVYYEFDKKPPYPYCEMQVYWDNTGTGANLNFVHDIVKRLIIDSLRYWVEEFHIDGFRFDLAPVLGNVIEYGGFKYDKTKLLTDIQKEFPNTKLIAEPWAASGEYSYQSGNFPSKWAEWNDKFRTGVRRFIIGEVGNDELKERILGSKELYKDDGRGPYASINYVTSHDGFTLYDLVSYDHPNNSQNYPCGPSDGGNYDNDSKNWGADWMKIQQMRNFLTLIFISSGTPMILGGDEFARTQNGNNNAYNMDTECMWFDWSRKTTYDKLFQFTKGLIAFRKAHPVFHRTSYLEEKDHGDTDDSIPDIQWHGVEYLKPNFSSSNRTLAFRLDGSKEETGASSNDNDIYVAINATDQKPMFQLPPNHKGKKWYRVADTDNWAENSDTIKNNIEPVGQEDINVSDGSWTDIDASSYNGNHTYTYGVNPFSIVILIEK